MTSECKNRLCGITTAPRTLMTTGREPFGTIFSGIFDHPYDIHHKDTKLGVLITMIPATLMILLIKSPFDGLIYSQMFLAVQLPITIFTQIYLTSSKKVMGKYANSKRLKIILFMIALIVTFLNICLFVTGF